MLTQIIWALLTMRILIILAIAGLYVAIYTIIESVRKIGRRIVKVLEEEAERKDREKSF